MADFPATLEPDDLLFSSLGAFGIQSGSTSFGDMSPPIPPTPTIYFNMRAWNTNLLEYVYWQAANAPDFTGASSGYPPGDLAFICVQVTTRA